jgi:RHS repeat-associated protein
MVASREQISTICSRNSFWGATEYNQMNVALRETYFRPGTEFSLAEWHLYGSRRLGIYQANKQLATYYDSTLTTITYSTRIQYRTNGSRRFELSNHLGNVLATVSDKRIAVCTLSETVAYYKAEMITASDYYAYGSYMEGRYYEVDTSFRFRFGYQGSEKDDEISSKGGHISTFFREGDTRLVIWWSPDPKGHVQPWQSPYSFMNGNPILFNDPLGDCPPFLWTAARWLASRAIPLFFGGATLSVGVQFAGNYIYFDDAKKAISNIDLVDAAADGTINVLTGGAGSFRTLFKQGTKVAIKKASAIITLELISATIDYKFEGSKFETVFSKDKSFFEATASFVLSLGSQYTSDQIKTMFKKWVDTDMMPKNFAPKTKEEKELVRKMNTLVKSKAFQGAVENGTSMMEEFVDTVLGSNLKMEVKKISEANEFEQKQDNTSVAPPVVWPPQ